MCAAMDESDKKIKLYSNDGHDRRQHQDEEFPLIRLTQDEFMNLSKEELYSNWQKQNSIVGTLKTNLDESNRRNEQLQENLEHNKRKLHDSRRRENNLKMKLAFRDKKLQELSGQLSQVVQSQLPTANQLEATLIDPAINLMFEKMKSEVDQAKTRAEEMQNELSAWKFTPDSNTGKRLMAKCRLLHNENEELGKDISQGWVAQLTGNLALQKKFSEEMKKSQSELDEFLLELEEEVEGMQNTIYYLQQQLRDAREERRSAQGCSTSENVSSPPMSLDITEKNTHNTMIKRDENMSSNSHELINSQGAMSSPVAASDASSSAKDPLIVKSEITSPG